MKLVRETLISVESERKREQKPDEPERETITKPKTKPTTRPSRPSPIPRHRPSVTPKPKAVNLTPKATIEDLLKKYKKASEK